MNVNSVKLKLRSMVGKNVSVKVDIGRNKHEVYEGILYATYPAIFTIKVGDIIKSFSYNDVISKEVIITII